MNRGTAKHDMVTPVDELIRFSRSWGQRSRSYKVILEKLGNKISPKGVQGSSPNVTW